MYIREYNTLPEFTSRLISAIKEKKLFVEQEVFNPELKENFLYNCGRRNAYDDIIRMVEDVLQEMDELAKKEYGD